MTANTTQTTALAVFTALPFRRLPAPPLRHALLKLPRDVGHQAHHALHRHHLSAMVHLVLFRREQHLEPALGRRFDAGRLSHRFCQERLGQPLEKRRELVSFGPQKSDRFSLGLRLRLLGVECLHQFRKVQRLEVRNLVHVNVALKARCVRDMGKSVLNRPGVRRGPEVVFALRNLFGHLDRVVAHRPKRRRELFPTVVRHVLLP